MKFEKALGELEDAVGRLESGDVGVDEAIKVFESGLASYKTCLKIINEAEQKVEKLVKGTDGIKTTSLDA